MCLRLIVTSFRFIRAEKAQNASFANCDPLKMPVSLSGIFSSDSAAVVLFVDA